MKTGDEVIIQMDQDRPGLIDTWSIRGLLGQEGKITSTPNKAGILGYGTSYGVQSQETIWTVQVKSSGSPLGYNVPEALLKLKENTNGGNTMLVSVRILAQKKGEDEQILVPATEFVAKDQNTALLRVGAENSDVIKKAIADGLAVRPIVQTIASS